MTPSHSCPPPAAPADPAPVRWIEAAVCAGGHETRYRRAGRGEPVLFLIEGPLAEAGSPDGKSPDGTPTQDSSTEERLPEVGSPEGETTESKPAVSRSTTQGRIDNRVTDPAALLAALAARARVIAVAACAVRLPDAPADSRWLPDFLDALALDRVTIISQSAGAPAAKAFARDFPERTRQLVLLSSPTTDPSLHVIRARMAANARAESPVPAHVPVHVPVHTFAHGGQTPAEIAAILAAVLDPAPTPRADS